MRRQIVLHWVFAAVLIAIAIAGSMPLWVRMLLVLVGLLQVGLVFLWRFPRDRMNAVYPD